ncbi:MAG: Appr-1-p processing protein [Euryarchaeota archaeon]|nr:Appr-1-p processing protein [Euryarchaeota archaeon]
MVEILIGDIFKSKAQTLVNTVNTVGVMGKGIALEFKNRYPKMFDDYKKRCDQKQVKLGKPYLYKTVDGPWVLNFPTKDHWRSISRLSDITEGLQYLERNYRGWGIQSLAVPPLGCGNGELDWRVVGPVLYRYLGLLDIPVELYAPYGTPDRELTPEFLKEQATGPARNQAIYKETINPAWVVLVEILDRIDKEAYHWPVGRTIFQKIAFVATMEGIPTDLEFSKGTYGPYSETLRELQVRLVNNGLVTETRKGNMISIRAGQTYPDARKEYIEEIRKWEEHIEKIVDLFNRVSTAKAEILSTILFSAKRLEERNGHFTEMELLEAVMEWKHQKQPPLDEKVVAGDIRSLETLGWVRATPSAELPVDEGIL